MDERHGFKHLVQGPGTSRHDDKAVGILHQNDLAGEEVAHLDGALHVGIGLLFERQLDIDPDGAPTGLKSTLVAGLHDARATSGHHGKAHAGTGFAHAAGEFVIFSARFGAR